MERERIVSLIRLLLVYALLYPYTNIKMWLNGLDHWKQTSQTMKC